MPETVEIKISEPAPKLTDFEVYEEYKQCCELWSLTTDASKKKLGLILAGSLPDKHPVFGKKIKIQCLQEVTLAVLQTEEGYDKVIEWMDKRLGKKTWVSRAEAFLNVLSFKRNNMPITQYLDELDVLIGKCNQAKINFPDECQGYILIANAGLTTNQGETLRGNIDMEAAAEKGELYDKVKYKLREILISPLIGGAMGESEKAATNEQMFLSEHEDIYAAWLKSKRPYGKKNYGKYNNQGYNKSKVASNSDNYAHKQNPKNRKGELMLCRVCNSNMHLERECQHKRSTYEKERNTRYKPMRQQAHVTEGENTYRDTDYSQKDSDSDDDIQNRPSDSIYYTADKAELSQFTSEALNMAALDTCCTSSVAGEKWMNIYLKAIPKTYARNVMGPYQSSKTFMFGNEGILKAGMAYKIPIVIAEQLSTIEVDVIKSDIPLLLSREDMKKLGIGIDIKNDRVTVHDKPIPLVMTSAGHFTIDLIGKEDVPIMEQVCIVDIMKEDEKTQMKLLQKLHRQFGHRPKKVFVKLLQDAGKWCKHFSEMLDQIMEGCEGCVMRRRVPDRPAVALEMASDFNEVIAMDLKFWGDKYILYIIDCFSRYTLGTVIDRKKPECVIDALFKVWIQYFGIPDKLITDNGGEFSNAEMLEVSGQLNVVHLTTASEAAWMNGLCEKNHETNDNILGAIVRDYPEMNLKSALAWACTAKNSLSNVYGFSPFQIVFGKNPRLPSILNDPPPAWEIKPMSKTLLQNLILINRTREEFVKSLSCAKIKKALLSRVRTMDRVYKPGQEVYYKRDRDDAWSGPAKVVAQDNKIILIKHGGSWKKISANRLIPKGLELAKTNELKEASETDALVDTNARSEEPDKNLETLDREQPLTKEIVEVRHIRRDNNIQTNNTNQVQDVPAQNSNINRETRNFLLVKKNDRLEVNLDGTWEKGTVKSRAAVATSKTYPNWYNLNMDNGRQLNLQLTTESARKITPEEEAYNNLHEDIMAVMVSKEKRDNPECLEAKLKELEKLKEFDTYEVVDDIGQKHITTTWVLTEKGNEIRARLTCRGFQEEEDFPKDSPTMEKSSLRLLLALAAAKGWDIQTSDIKSAFLQGSKLEREVHVRPPKESNAKGKLWRLLKCLYGLKDASRQWYLKVMKCLKAAGFQKSRFDAGLFYLVKDGQLMAIIGLHVDDFLHVGCAEFNNAILPSILENFKVGKSESRSFMYTGFLLEQSENGVTIDQAQYVANIDIPTLSAERMLEKDAEMSLEELSVLRQMTGILNWVTRATRPDLCFDMINLSTKFKGGVVKDLKEAKKTLANLKQNQAKILISDIGDLAKAEIWCFTDAAFGNINNGKDSTGSYIIFLVNKDNGKSAPIQWKSNKTRRRVQSSLAAEALSLSAGLDTAIALKWMIADLTGLELPVKGVIDNKSTCDAVYSSTDVSEKRLRREIAIIQEMIEVGEVKEIRWLKGEDQLADALTKRGASTLKLMKVLQKGEMGAELLNLVR